MGRARSPGITPHSFDSSQRLVNLDITNQGEGVVSVVAPAQANTAPPGWYMLFITDGA